MEFEVSACGTFRAESGAGGLGSFGTEGEGAPRSLGSFGREGQGAARKLGFVWQPKAGGGSRGLGSFGNTACRAGAGNLTDGEEGLHGALVHGVEASFIPLKARELTIAGWAARGIGRGHDFSLDRPNPADAPVAGAHILDHGHFDGVRGVELFDVKFEECVEAFPGFVGGDSDIGDRGTGGDVLPPGYLFLGSHT